jgi:hypothetical protein
MSKHTKISLIISLETAAKPTLQFQVTLSREPLTSCSAFSWFLDFVLLEKSTKNPDLERKAVANGTQT